MTRHQPPEARKRQILDAAADCFARAGYQATRMEDIASRCELSKGALYHQFDSKSAIVLALAQRWVERVVSTLSTGTLELETDLAEALDPSLFVVLLAESAREQALRILLANGIRRVTEALGQQVAPQHEAQWDSLMTLALGVMLRSMMRAEDDLESDADEASITEVLKTLRSSSKPRYRVQYVETRQ